MSLHNYLKGDASTPQAPGGDKSWTGQNPGPYLAIVKNNIDPTKMGRLQVLIPTLVKATDPEENQLITCDYLAPFYGAKGGKFVKGSGIGFEDSQHSYGMWMVPPDLETKVLVIFAEGKMEQAYWIGCVQEPFTNHMTPGIASSTNTNDALDGTFEGADAGFQQDKQSTYGSKNVPSGELNRNRAGALQNNNYESIPKPIHPFAETLLAQGLSADNIRGNTSSSARRETPSAVFGISTPGRKDTGSTQKKVGVKGSTRLDYVTRGTGHTFVMDDGAVDGTNQLTRLRTASGHQLLMHDTDGVVYIANGSGNAYVEMQKNGRIDLYSGVGGINLRTEGDFNLHSDSNINMHAGGQIRISSSGELIQSSGTYMMNLGDKGIFNSSQAGSIRDYARDGLSSFTEGSQLHGASGQIHLAGAQVHFNSTSASSAWGPTWLNTDAAGITERDEGDVELAQKGIKPLEPFTRQTKTTVHRFVTHEPMFRASVIAGDSVIPIDVDDKKQWSKNANTPGTPEFVNNKNRLSANSAIRDAQYQADALTYVKQKMGNSTNAVKAKKLLTDFGTQYNEIYGITEKVNLPFDIKDSISEKIKGFSVNSSVKDLTDSLTSQVIENFTGKSKALFKDNVFVNSAGELFSLGGSVSGSIDLANNALNTLDGLTKNLSTKNFPATISSISSITQNYQSVVGGQIVGINQVKSLASKAGLFNAREAGIMGQSFLKTLGTNLGSSIGSIAGKVSTFFSGSGSVINTPPISGFTGGLSFGGFSTGASTGTSTSVVSTQGIFQTFVADSGTTTANSATDTLTVSGGTDISTSISGDTLTISYTGSGGGGGSQNLFSTIAVAGQSNVVADSTTDTLTLVAGSNMTITTNASGDSITFASAGGGGGSTSPGGSNTQVQFNNSGSFGGDSDFTYDSSSNTLTVKNVIADSINPPATLTGTFTLSSPTTITLDPTDEIINDAPMKLVSKTVAQLGSLTSSAGAIVYCTDETGGSIPAFYDGTNWRRVSDRAIVS